MYFSRLGVVLHLFFSFDIMFTFICCTPRSVLFHRYMYLPTAVCLTASFLPNRLTLPNRLVAPLAVITASGQPIALCACLTNRLLQYCV